MLLNARQRAGISKFLIGGDVSGDFSWLGEGLTDGVVKVVLKQIYGVRCF